MRRSLLIGGLTAVLSSLAAIAARDARACGGCFHPPTQVATDITDERMLLSVSTTQTTLYDQIRYSGSPSSFAWVLPIHGTVDVGLSADVLFDSIDTLTATEITPPPSSCQPAPCQAFATGATAPSLSAADAGAAAVTVLKQANVGPYATVQLQSTDASALNAWLSQNGFSIPDAVAPVIAEYVSEGFNFLAMKLLPNAGVQAMRPVRVTTPGASLSLPLRMAAIGTGNIVGITVWVVADGRYEPQNFLFFHIDDVSLVWDWSTSSSNYTTLRAQNDANFHNAGWEIESSLTLNQQTITSVILSGGQSYRGVAFGVTDPTIDYLPIASPDAGADGGVGETAEEVRTDDIAALFAGLASPNVRITRIRSDIAHSAITSDLVFRASADQSELSNVRNLTQGVNESCPVYNGCNVVGTVLVNSSGGAGGESTGSYSGFTGSYQATSGTNAVTGSYSGSTGTAVTGSYSGSGGFYSGSGGFYSGSGGFYSGSTGFYQGTSGTYSTTGSYSGGTGVYQGTTGLASSGSSQNGATGASSGAYLSSGNSSPPQSGASGTSGTTVVTASGSRHGGGGCSASPAAPADSSAAWGGLVGMFGLSLLRRGSARRKDVERV